MSEALAAHDRAVAAAPGEPEFLFNRSTSYLMAGDFARGWDTYEWQWQNWPGHVRSLGSLWQGEEIAGCTILLHAEQGLGDTLQFVCYVPLVAARGARVVLEVQPPLVRLLRALPGAHQVIARGDALPSYDIHCPLLSLPRAFAARLETIPCHLPYLHGDADAIAAWGTKLPDDQRVRVGIVWAGSPHLNDAAAHLINRRRSISLAELAPLGDVAGVHLVSLRKDRPDGLEWAPPGVNLIDLMPSVVDFADTAGLVSNLDLVIAVDTSVAHLAARLGRPVWLLARYNGCWRWMHDRLDSPWYPGMRIFRQQRPMDWFDVIQRVRADLAAVAKRVWLTSRLKQGYRGCEA